MKSITLSIATSLFLITLLMSVGLFTSNSFAQGNQTNQSGGVGQQNQTGIGTASQVENLTSGNTVLPQNASLTGSENASMAGGMNQTGEAVQTGMNQTGKALTNASKSNVAQNISQGAQEIGQTTAKESGDVLGSISEGLKGFFGGGNK
jgi:hypothetical protein